MRTWDAWFIYRPLLSFQKQSPRVSHSRCIWQEEKLSVMRGSGGTQGGLGIRGRGDCGDQSGGGWGGQILEPILLWLPLQHSQREGKEKPAAP